MAVICGVVTVVSFWVNGCAGRAQRARMSRSIAGVVSFKTTSMSGLNGAIALALVFSAKSMTTSVALTTVRSLRHKRNISSHLEAVFHATHRAHFTLGGNRDSRYARSSWVRAGLARTSGSESQR